MGSLAISTKNAHESFVTQSFEGSARNKKKMHSTQGWHGQLHKNDMPLTEIHKSQ